MINLSPVAFALRKEVHAHGVALSNTHALELIAAAMAYGSLAALQADEKKVKKTYLADADHIVLRQSGFDERLGQLGLLADPDALKFDTLVSTLAAQWQPNTVIHRSVADFKDYLAQETQERAWIDNAVNDAYAETNASPDEFYTDDFEDDGDLFTEPDAWSIRLSGTHTGEQHADRPYLGHRGSFEATYLFDKAGRCGLVETDFTIELDFNRDGDYDLS